MKLNNHGQALVEYILIVSLIVGITIFAMTFLSGYIKDAITRTACNIAGTEFVESDERGEGHCLEDPLFNEQDLEY